MSRDISVPFSVSNEGLYRGGKSDSEWPWEGEEGRLMNSRGPSQGRVSAGSERRSQEGSGRERRVGH